MGKKTLTNAHCLLELVELAGVPTLKAFSGLQECQALARGFDWSQVDDQLSVALVEHIKHLRKEIARLSAEEIERLQTEAQANGKAEYVLELQLTDGSGEVVALSRGIYQLRKH